jgi:RNase P/RNase MRP subunit p29
MNHFFKSILILTLIIFSFLFFCNNFCLADKINTKGWKGIIIKEIFPNPADKDFDKEWIKIYNNSNKEINLKNWLLIDSFGNITPFVFLNNLWLEDDDYLILKRENTNIILNNFKETLSLFTPDGDLADQISYANAPEEKIYIFESTDSSWNWENTKKNEDNTKNQIASETDNNKIIKNDWENIEIDQRITIEGIVLTLPNQMSSQYFFLSYDKNQSKIIQIYNYKKEFPNFKIGEKLQISGTTSKISNWKRLKTNELNNFVNLNQKEEINIQKLENNLNKSNLGKIFSIKGKIEKINKNSLKINYNNISFLVNTELLNVSFNQNDTITLKGQLLYSNNEYYLKALPTYNLLSKKDEKNFSLLASIKNINIKNIFMPLSVCLLFLVFLLIKVYNVSIKKNF